MKKEDITALFDQMASSYDEKWSHTAAINSALHLLTGAVLGELPQSARILCVGAGTGAEIFYLAKRFPHWHFTAVEPSGQMMNVLRGRADNEGIASRCAFHQGYLESLPPMAPFDAATSFLVSQFILDRNERTNLFRDISGRLISGGILVSSDLAGDLHSAECRRLLKTWLRLTTASEPTAEAFEKMRESYASDVAVLPPTEVEKLISAGGFDQPIQFYQAGLIHAWYATRSGS